MDKEIFKFEAYESDECTPSGPNHPEYGIKDCCIMDTELCVDTAHIVRQYRDGKRRHDIEVKYANLFAAAPELLDALKGIMSIEFHDENGNWREGFIAATNAAAAAIAKATGEAK
jgi:hypothetical protein